MSRDISAAKTVAMDHRRGSREESIEVGVPSRRNQRGMVSAEWAVGIIAAVAIAGVLLAIVTSGEVEKTLLNFILMVIRSFSDYIK
jgi:Protein of unknown function (DUF4244)